MPLYYPVFLDITGRNCIVVGGGKVALRKVRVLLEHGAQVRVVSSVLCTELSHLAEEGVIRAALRDYKPDDLKGTFIAVAATSENEINEEVAREARKKGILVNVVDDPKHSDFIVPSYLRREDVVIAVSTGGRSPALARKIRTELEKRFGTEYATLAQLLDEVRSDLRQKGISVESDAWQQALELDSLIELVHSGRDEEAKRRVVEALESFTRSQTT